MSPSETRSPLLRSLVERGFFYQCTDLAALDERAAAGRLVGYTGFDCTAESLHVGSLVQIMLLRRLQQAGHRPIVLLGGGTSKIGDPTLRDESRKLMSDEQIARNMAGIRTVFERFLTFGDGPADAIMVDNAEWLDRLALIPFLRDIGQHFTVNRMLSFDSVRLRMEREQSLSFLEFNYMILQAYDFIELARRYDCTLQLAGSDQWGNIVCGIDLGRRVLERELLGFTTPLLTTASGSKMGKTAAGAVWLNADKLAPYDYWQYWRNTEDADVGRFLRLFTELPIEEVARLEALQGAELNDAKKVLATEATALLHGRDAALSVADAARRVFEQGERADSMPSAAIERAAFARGIPVIELFVRAGLASSNSEARRLIKQGGARMNDRALSSETLSVGTGDLGPDGSIKLSAGKKRHALVRAVD